MRWRHGSSLSHGHELLDRDALIRGIALGLLLVLLVEAPILGLFAYTQDFAARELPTCQIQPVLPSLVTRDVLYLSRLWV